MAENELLAITAIKDMHEEGSIAASLLRLGWRVIYRATSPELLIQNVEKYPEAVILLSDDFLDPGEIAFRNVSLLRGRSEPISVVGAALPRNDFELGELLRGLNREKEVAREVIPATQSRVIAFTSTQGGIGVTTLAINVADQISSLGERVLLVDACSMRGSLAEHFELHDIRSSARDIHENLSLLEISELAQLIYLANIAVKYDYIVLDLGVTTEKSISGSRVLEQTFQWIIHSQGKLFVASGSSQKALARNFQFMKKIHNAIQLINLESVITLDSPLSRRDRARLEKENSQRYSTHTSTFSRDVRSIQMAEESGTTLRLSVPRSLVYREISRFTSERVIRK